MERRWSLSSDFERLNKRFRRRLRRNNEALYEGLFLGLCVADVLGINRSIADTTISSNSVTASEGPVDGRTEDQSADERKLFNPVTAACLKFHNEHAFLVSGGRINKKVC